MPTQPGSDETRAIPDEIREELSQAIIEIGHEAIPQHLFVQTQKALEQAPPLAFDVARHVRVFLPYIQYVEISMRGCAIQRHRIEVPRSFQDIAPHAELTSRLRTTFDLIERSSDVSSQPLEDELKKIRDELTRALGKPWGRVLLRSTRPLFDKRINELRDRLAQHRKAVRQSLADRLDDSRKQLVGHFLPLFRASPPDALLGRSRAENRTTPRSRHGLMLSWAVSFRSRQTSSRT